MKTVANTLGFETRQEYAIFNSQILKVSKTWTALFAISLFSVSTVFGQYVSPNQPGRKGGSTLASPSTYNQIATSTYYGTDGTLVGQGTLIIADKNPTNGTYNQNGRVLHYFKGTVGADAGYSWYTTPFTASDGNLYGSSFYGGNANVGAVYKFNVANAQTGACTGNESVIYNMGGIGGTYGNYGNVNELSNDSLYIPETAGGPYAYGKMTKISKAGGTATTVHDFKWAYVTDPNIYSAGAKLQPGYSALYANDGAYPYGFPTEGPDGYVYGTTLWGGQGGFFIGYGTVYKMKKDGSDYKILAYSSTGSSGIFNSADGSTVTGSSGLGGMPFGVPWGNVAFDKAGVYAYFFGGYLINRTYGDICRVKIDGSEPVQIVHKFLWDGASTTQPYYLYRGPIIIENELFGTTYYGGSGRYGTVFKLDLSKLNPTDNPINALGVNNTVQILHNFGFADGAYPFSGLVYDGNFLYGSTQQGGYVPSVSYGTVYKIKPDGTGFQSILDLKNSPNSCPPTTPINQQINYAYYTGAERVTLLDLTSTACQSCLKTESICIAGTNAPIIAATTIANTCPTTTFSLASLTNTGTAPSGTSLIWSTHKVPVSIGDTLANTTTVSSGGKYYVMYRDKASNCYSPADSVTATVTACPGSIAFSTTPPTQTANTGSPKLGNAATELTPVGGTGTYTYSNGSGDPTCVAPSGATLLSPAPVIIAATGAYTYTAPITAGTYYYCIKVCDTTLLTPLCKVQTYTLVVTVPCAVGAAAPSLK